MPAPTNTLDIADANAEIERLKALLAKKNTAPPLTLKVSEKGAMSIYGLGRWPVTLYKEQMKRLLDHSDAIRAFLDTHDHLLKAKE